MISEYELIQVERHVEALEQGALELRDLLNDPDDDTPHWELRNGAEEKELLAEILTRLVAAERQRHGRAA